MRRRPGAVGIGLAGLCLTAVVGASPVRAGAEGTADVGGPAPGDGGDGGGAAGPDGGAADAGATEAAHSPPTTEEPASASPPVRPPAPRPGPPEPIPPSRYETVVIARPAGPDTPRADVTAAASVVRPDDSPRAIDDLGSLLSETPGVNVVRTGSLGAASTITLRGANPDQVRVYVDGVPINVAAGGGVDVSTLPIGDVERVEIYRGASPLSFGPSAMGGIVSITTRTPGATPARARGGVGSFGSAFGDAMGGGRLGRLRLYAGLHGLSSRGDFPYLNDNGTALNPGDDVRMPRANNDLRQVDGVVRGALELGGRRTLLLGTLGVVREQGLPGRGGFPTRDARFATARGLGYLRYQSRDDLGPGGELSAGLHGTLQRDRLDDAAGESGLGGPAVVRSTTRSAGASAHLARPISGWIRAALVLQGQHEIWRPVNELAAVPIGVPARRLSGVAGTEVDFLVRRLDLNVVPSFRMEVVDDVVSRRDGAGAPIPAGPSLTRLLPVLRLGLVRPLGRWGSLRANVGRYARAPSFIELYGNGTARVLGNAELTEERGTNADLALWIDRAGDRVAVVSRTTAFAARVSDLIQWEYAAWGQARADNIGRASIEGIEQELRLGFGRWLRLVGQATYLRARDRSATLATNGRQLPFHPTHRSYVRPEVDRLPLGGGLELGAYADAELRAQTYTDGANLLAMGARLLLGCGLTVSSPERGLRLTASAANLTGTQKEDVNDWALPGRMVFLSLAYTPAGFGQGGSTAPFNPRYGP